MSTMPNLSSSPQNPAASSNVRQDGAAEAHKGQNSPGGQETQASNKDSIDKKKATHQNPSNTSPNPTIRQKLVLRAKSLSFAISRIGMPPALDPSQPALPSTEAQAKLENFRTALEVMSKKTQVIRVGMPIAIGLGLFAGGLAFALTGHFYLLPIITGLVLGAAWCAAKYSQAATKRLIDKDEGLKGQLEALREPPAGASAAERTLAKEVFELLDGDRIVAPAFRKSLLLNLYNDKLQPQVNKLFSRVFNLGDKLDRIGAEANTKQGNSLEETSPGVDTGNESNFDDTKKQDSSLGKQAVESDVEEKKRSVDLEQQDNPLVSNPDTEESTDNPQKFSTEAKGKSRAEG